MKPPFSLFHTHYLERYKKQAKEQNVSPAHVMALTIIREVLKTTGITATVGIGTNLFLAKVGMDIVAKRAPADSDGVRIAELPIAFCCCFFADRRNSLDGEEKTGYYEQDIGRHIK